MEIELICSLKQLHVWINLLCLEILVGLLECVESVSRVRGVVVGLVMLKGEQLHSCAASSRDPAIGATVFLCQWRKRKEMCQRTRPLLQLVRWHRMVNVCVRCRESRMTQVEVSEISLTGKFATTPSVVRGKAV